MTELTDSGGDRESLADGTGIRRAHEVLDEEVDAGVEAPVVGTPEVSVEWREVATERGGDLRVEFGAADRRD